jgi:hypothetical protein
VWGVGHFASLLGREQGSLHIGHGEEGRECWGQLCTARCLRLGAVRDVLVQAQHPPARLSECTLLEMQKQAGGRSGGGGA